MLVVSLLFFVSIVVSKAGNRLGVPALLLFLCVGMVFGSDGLGIHFDNIETAQTIGTVALCIILFSGGMDTKIQDIRPVIAPGLVLATLGVFLTSFTTGLCIWFLSNKTGWGGAFGLTASLLLASTMSSTDSASRPPISCTEIAILLYIWVVWSWEMPNLCTSGRRGTSSRGCRGSASFPY